MTVRPVLIDDHLLARVLVDDPPEHLGLAERTVATSGLWLHRLGRAVMASPVVGSLSRRLSVDATIGTRLAASAAILPPEVDLISLRDLAWPMAQILADGERLNLLSLEALAAAEHLGAEMWLGVDDQNPPLIDAAARRGVTVKLIANA